jgi:hypothetical protein
MHIEAETGVTLAPQAARLQMQLKGDRQKRTRIDAKRRIGGE